MTRPAVYCVIPAELAPRLHDLLRDHFRDDQGVEVVVERRSGEERRGADGEPPDDSQGRQTPGPNRRRAAARRAATVPLEEGSPLPRRARRYADRIAFVERLESPSQAEEDRDTAELLSRAKAGDRDAYAALYYRYFDRVYGYMRVMLRQRQDAEDATQQVFIKVMERLPEQHLDGPFRAWLMTVVRNHAIDLLRRRHRILLTDEVPEDGYRAQGPEAEDELPALDWISDRDLLVFFERLPVSQRQVLLLRYLLDLSAIETAKILDRTPNDVSALQYRALRFLRERLAAVGRSAPHRDRTRMRTYAPQAVVLRRRRFALLRR